MPARIDLDEAKIVHLYTVQHLSSPIIGKMFGVCNVVILKRLRRNGVHIRDFSEMQRGKKLSEEHKKKIRFCGPKNGMWRNGAIFKGDKNPNWKGGIQKDSGYNDRKWRKWRKAVFDRDLYTCQICGIRGCELNAHHIKLKSKFPKLRYVVSNGITLCVTCHKDVHKQLRECVNV